MNDIDDDLRSLYRSARAAEDPTAVDRALVQAAVSATVLTASATAAAATTAPAVKALTLSTVLSSLAIGAAVGVGASATLLVSETARKSPTPHTIVRSVATSVPAQAAPKPRITSDAAPEVAPAPAERATAASSPAKTSAARAVAGSATSANAATSASNSSLTRESQGLAAIQSALASGAATRALELLAVQEAEFRHGELAEERAAVRVLALCAAGKDTLGRQARESFLRRYPQSPLTSRVLNSCARR